MIFVLCEVQFLILTKLSGSQVNIKSRILCGDYLDRTIQKYKKLSGSYDD
jgi:hypothetical protein